MKREREITSQLGLTLVELMIAMVIGLLLLAGVIQIFLSSKQSYRMQEGLSRLQENGRFAVDVMTSNLRHAGYRDTGLATDDRAFPVDTASYGPGMVTFSAIGQVVSGTENNTSGTDTILNGTDTISFRFHGSADIPAGSALRDCLNAIPNSGQMTVNTLYVDPQNELECTSVRTSSTSGPTIDTQPLLDGVEDMQVLYGVDTNGDFIANRYRTAASVTGNGEWASVVSVRIALLLSTVTPVMNVPDSNPYTLLNNLARTFNDGLRRHVFTATIALRNQLP